MIKPIVYHSFEEKEILAKKLIADIPVEKRLFVSKALMDIFYNAGKEKQSRSNHPAKNKSVPRK